MKHPYRDRFFADPFILDVKGDTVDILVEEKIFSEEGNITRLRVNAETMELIDRKVILDLETGLSYPYILRTDSMVYVIPENYRSGTLRAWEYDQVRDTLVNPRVICEMPLVDATLLQADDSTHIIISILGPNNAEAMLSRGESALGKHEFNPAPVVTGIERSRPGGDFFRVGSDLYRPAQDCQLRYGNALRIVKITSTDPWTEEEVVRLESPSDRYDLGFHTLNFHPSGYAVADAYGYLYPFFGRLIHDPALKVYQWLR